MAGIGFTLKKALGATAGLGKWRVYGAGAFVAAGSWLLTLVALFVTLGFGQRMGLDTGDRDLFLATVTYAMIGSNLLSTTGQFFLTRALADALYERAYDRLLSLFVGVFAYTGGAALVLATLWQAFLPLPFAYRVWTVLLTVILTQLGLLMILLSAARSYRAIATSFLAGLLFLLLALVAGSRNLHTVTWLLALFTLGQAVAFLLLGGVAVRDFPAALPAIYAFQAHQRRYPELLPIGFFYALALWCDNAVAWGSPLQSVLAGSYWVAPAYDLAKFWTFLALVPGFTLFNVHVETDFYREFRQFYDAIERGETLAEVLLFEEQLRMAARAVLVNMAKVQVFVSVLVWVAAEQLADAYPDVVEMLQWTILGAVPFLLFMTAFLLLLYFDARQQALWAVLFSVIALAGCTQLAIWLRLAMGVGFLAGALLMMVFTLLLLQRRLARLLYKAFYG